MTVITLLQYTDSRYESIMYKNYKTIQREKYNLQRPEFKDLNLQNLRYNSS